MLMNWSSLGILTMELCAGLKQEIAHATKVGAVAEVLIRLEAAEAWTEDRPLFLAAEHSAAAEQEVIGNYMYYGTSSTSLAVAPSGTFTLVTQTGLSWVANDKIVIWSGSSPANWIAGVVTSYSGTTIVFEASSSSGAGTYTDWRINLASGTIQHRHGYASEWEASNPVLLKAEIG